MENKDKKTNKTDLLLSTDSLAGYGLDLMFDIASKAGMTGIDLALRKNFDAWNIDYVSKLSQEYNLPIKAIQTSSSVNTKELNHALDLCAKLGTKIISINAPSIFDLRAYNFIVENIAAYRRQNPEIKFSIINPEQSSLFILPIPKYRFSNIVEIVKSFSCFIGLDLSNLDESALETEFLRKIVNFVPHISIVYLSDKTKLGEGHVMPGDGVLKLPTILKRFKQNRYNGPFSIKITIDKKDLADTDKTILILKKCKTYFKENFEEVSDD